MSKRTTFGPVPVEEVDAQSQLPTTSAQPHITVPQPHMPEFALIAPPALPAVSVIAPFETEILGAANAPVPENTLEEAD